MTDLEAFAIDLARIGGAAALPWFRGEVGIENKASGGAYDPVTEADRAAEAAMRQAIAARYPHHGVIGEEYGEDRPDAEHVWVLDPIDGTRAFVAGLPLWTCLVGLTQAGAPVVGAIGQPYLGEVFAGGPSGARLVTRDGETALAARPCPKLTDAVLATTDPDIFTGAELGAFTQVRAAARLTRLGCDAYAYAMVAAGRIDIVVESGLKPWDWTALAPVVRAAGGALVNWRGQAPDAGGQVLAVGDAALIDQALVTLRRSAL